MVHAQAFFQHFVLRCHHVVVVILREARAQAVARFARLSVADVVREYHEVASHIQQLSGAKEYVGKLRTQELPSAASRAVKNKHCIRYFAGGVANSFSERRVVQAQFRNRLPRPEMEIVGNVVALGRRRNAAG
jgi:hypothetical protein